MNTDYILNRWVPALRSGGYEQGKGQLMSTDGDSSMYCCLGVACDLLVKDGILPAWEPHPKGDGYTKMVADEYMYLPEMAVEYLGVRSRDPYVSFPDVQDGGQVAMSLSAANDDEEFSFEQIAGALEEMALADLADREES